MNNGVALQGRRILITGANSGIGLKFLTDAIAAGAQCVALVRDADAAAEIEVHLPASQCIEIDLQQSKNVANATREAIDCLGGNVDGLVTCAGVLDRRAGLETDLNGWQRVLDINLTGTFEVARICGRAMSAAGHGAMVLVSSHLTENSHGDIFDILQKVGTYKPKEVTISVYSDLTGSAEYNKMLAEKRGKYLQSEIKDAGAKKITINPVGAADPIVEKKGKGPLRTRAPIAHR